MLLFKNFTATKMLIAVRKEAKIIMTARYTISPKLVNTYAMSKNRIKPVKRGTVRLSVPDGENASKSVADNAAIVE